MFSTSVGKKLLDHFGYRRPRYVTVRLTLYYHRWHESTLGLPFLTGILILVSLFYIWYPLVSCVFSYYLG